MTPLEFLYYLGYSIKKRYALKNQKRLPYKVISIGNITLGGTGKTPATIAIAEESKRRGLKPCILTRGYKGKAIGPCFVSRGEGPLLDEYRAGDEALLMAEKLNGIPIVKGKNRHKAGLFAIQNLKSQIFFILDDGFQHWGLFRDKDIILIDSTNVFGNRRLLPLGPLREPIGAMSRADIIVITKSEVRSQKSEVNGLVEEIRQYNTRAPIFFAEHKPSKFITAIRNQVAATSDTISSEWAKEKKFFGFCGIGNPQSFRKTLLSAGVELIGFKTFRDHYRYSRTDIQRIIRDAEMGGAEWIVTTEKDIMRLKGFDLPENLVSLGIEFSVDKRFYEEVFMGIENSNP